MTPPVVPVTVIIPAYNAEAFIARALRMLAQQTVWPAEVIVVDDGSIDATARIACDLGARVLSVPHGGIAAARNAALAVASGEWIAFLDADDLWDPAKLAVQWQVVTENPGIDFIVTSYDMVTESGAIIRLDAVSSLRQVRALARPLVGDRVSLLDRQLLATSAAEWNFFLPSCVMLSRELARTVGDFERSVKMEDVEYFLRCIAAGRIAFVRRPLVGYVVHGGNHTATYAPRTAALALCEFVLSHPARYHEASVRTCRNRHPILLAHAAATALRARRPAESARLLARAALAAGRSSAVPRTLFRLAVKNGAVRRAFERIRPLALEIELIPGNDGRAASGGDSMWSGLIARTDTPA